MSDSIGRLVKEVEMIYNSDRNQQTLRCWQGIADFRGKFRGFPTDRRDLDGKIPFIADFMPPLWSRIFGYNVQEYYTDPETFLQYYLQQQIYQFEELQDDTPILKAVPIYMGTGFESGLYGAVTLYSDTKDPWVAREHILKEPADLAKLEPADFYTTGQMPLVHEFYRTLTKLLPDDWQVIFPELGRGPFGVAVHLRGYDTLLMDLILNPKFVQDLLGFLVEDRIRWTQERAKFLGSDEAWGNLNNDEVCCPMLSPALYEEMILPHEIKIAEFHGGAGYWHSCGNITELLPLIKRIPGLKMVQVSPQTDLPTACRLFAHASLELDVNSVRDILDASEETMAAKLHEYKDDLIQNGHSKAYIRAGSLAPLGTLDQDLAKIKTWIKLAREILG
ncbi:MAG: uroporphyrinogen decarboxylase family protein [Limnochordia bacterium]|nr:hypothetical protein [Bacillota bacterium]